MTDGPMQAAQRLMRPELPKRFYKSVDVAEQEGGYAVLLDGRSVRTPAKNVVLVPYRGLAEAMAEEWRAQTEFIDPSCMPLTKLVNSALDGVARQAQAVRAEIVKYAGSDLLCYRAGGPDRLVERQNACWNPVLAWARAQLGEGFTLAEGVMFVEQPRAVLDNLDRALEEADTFQLAALNTVTTLTGSAILAFALYRGELSADEAWKAAHVDEDWTIELWGEDEEAQQRRAARYQEMAAAASVIKISRLNV